MDTYPVLDLDPDPHRPVQTIIIFDTKNMIFFTNATIWGRNLTMNMYCMQGAGKLAALAERKWKSGEEKERQEYMSRQPPGYIHSAGGHKPHTINQILPFQYARRGIWNILKYFFPLCCWRYVYFVGLGCMPTVPPNLVMAHRRKNTLQHTKIHHLLRQQQRRRLIYRWFNFTG